MVSVNLPVWIDNQIVTEIENKSKELGLKRSTMICKVLKIFIQSGLSVEELNDKIGIKKIEFSKKCHKNNLLVKGK